MKNLFNLTGRERLLARLQAYSSGPKPIYPPEPPSGRTMAELGISKTRLDAFVRPWVNAEFGKGKDLYKRGDLKPSITYGELCTKCGV